MWFCLGIRDFIVKKVVTDDHCRIFVSDFRKIWHKFMSNDELISTSQKLNSHFEAPPQNFKQLTLELFSKDKNILKEIEGEKELVLKLESNRMGVKYQFEVKLAIGDEEMFYNEFTLPALIMMVTMQNKEKKLITTLKANEFTETKSDYTSLKHDYGAKNSVLEKEFVNEDEESLISLVSNVINHPSSFLDSIDKEFLYVEHIIKTTREKQVSLNKVEDEKSSCEDSGDKNNLVNTHKSNQRNNFAQSVSLNHQMVKRRKKEQNKTFNIKF